VRVAAGEGILQEMEHGEELAGRHEHVVAEPAGDDGYLALVSTMEGSSRRKGLQ
jgi:hypothetical protein